MDATRQLLLNKNPFNGKSVLYVMSRDQRVHDNHALLAAQALAIEQKIPLYVLFVLKKVESRSREHYQFMLDGLSEVAATLKSFKIPFVIRLGDATAEILDAAHYSEAGAIFFDFNPLPGPRGLAKQVAKDFAGTVSVVDAHNIISTWVASTKQEFAAHTMRSKVHKLLGEYITEPTKIVTHPVPAPKVPGASFKVAQNYITIIPACGISVTAVPGEKAARTHLKTFIAQRLETYAIDRNNISDDSQSGLSPYLHFGQISSLRVVLEVMSAVHETPLLLTHNKLAQAGDQPSKVDGMNALFEEMIVRKELSDNFCLYNEHYKTLAGAPAWAQATLADHAKDPREFLYTKEQWERAETHDDAWNAAQTELTKTGKLHGYMRMYWAKKILEWSASPQEAIDTAVHLNDKYSIDGGDPNGYVGILWSVAGLHDRPWFERPVYGKIRYMNDVGLRRKFDVDAYIKRVKNT